MKVFINVINSIISLKWVCQTFRSASFQHLKNFVFFSKLVSYNIKVCLHYNLLNHFLFINFLCGHILADNGWWWMVVGGDRWWNSLA